MTTRAKKQDLGKHSFFVALDGHKGRLTLDEGIALGQLVGVMPDADEAGRQFLAYMFRRLVRQYRKSKQDSGEIHLELVNLFEFDEEGRKVNYNKHCGELTVDEAVKHLGYWDGVIAKSQRQYQRYREFHLGRLGDELQGRLDFGPDDPTPEDN
jgi:hypothetical protein